MALATEQFLAYWARILPDGRMGGHVFRFIVIATKRFIADFASERLLARMDSHVLDELVFERIMLTANVANVRMNANMLQALMQTPIGHQIEDFRTEIAREGLHSILFDFHFVE